MKTRLLMTSLLTLASAVLVAGPADALMIAGWDFSQYAAENQLTTDGATGADTLSANYSNLDLTFGAGAASAAYGTMYINGQFGSTAVDPFAPPTAVTPLFPSLTSNLNAPLVSGVPAGAVPFDTLNVLLDEQGQTFANTLSMLGQSPMDMVFNAHLPGQATGWGLTFAGKTLSGTASVGISFSIDGLSYSAPTLVSLDTNDKPFEVLFGSFTANNLYVRLNLPTANGLPIIDNVAINATVPEPGLALLLGVALAGAGAIRRRQA